MNIHTIISQARGKQVRNTAVIFALILITVGSIIALLGMLISLLHPLTAGIFTAVSTLFSLSVLAFFFNKKLPTNADTALLLDQHAGSKERIVSLLKLEDVPDSDPRKALLIKQIEVALADVSFREICPLLLPRRLKQLLCVVPFLWFALGWLAAPRFFYTHYTDPVAQEIQQLIEAEADSLPEPLKESLTELADAVESNALNSDEVLNALANAESDLGDAFAELAQESSANELVVEASEQFDDTSQNGEQFNQKDDISELQPEATPTPEPTRANQAAAQQDEKKPTPTPTPQSSEAKESGGDSEQSSEEKSEVSNEEEEGDGDGSGSKNSGGGQSGDGDSEEDSSGSEQSQESSSKSGGGKNASSGEQNDKQGNEGKENEQRSEGGKQSAQTQPGKQESQSGGKKGEQSEGGSPSESGEQSEGEDGQDTSKEESGAEQGLSRVKEKLENLKQQTGKGAGKDSQDKEQAQKELDKESKDKQSEEKADKAEDQESEKEGKTSGKGPEKSSGDKPEQSDAQSKQNSETPPEFNDAAMGQSGASTQNDSDREKEEEGQGEGFAAGETPGFSEVHIPGEDEKFDTRHTGQDTQRTAGRGGEKYKVELEDVELAKPDLQEGNSEQRIPLEYRNILGE